MYLDQQETKKKYCWPAQTSNVYAFVKPHLVKNYLKYRWLLPVVGASGGSGTNLLGAEQHSGYLSQSNISNKIWREISLVVGKLPLNIVFYRNYSVFQI